MEEKTMSEKKLLGKVSVPVGTEKWFRYVKKNGEVWTVKPVRNVLSPEEKVKREAERKAKHDAAREQKVIERQKAKLERQQTKAKAKEAYNKVMGK